MPQAGSYAIPNTNKVHLILKPITMSFFSNFFGNNTNAVMNETEPRVDKALFVDDSNPMDLEVTEKATDLNKLLKKDYRSEGFVLGYEEHCADIMELRLNSIVSGFQQAMSSEIDVLVAAMGEMSDFLTKEYQELMPNQYLKLRTRYDALN